MAMRLGEPQIQEGALGGDVRTLQQILVGQGYNTGGIDGIYGPMTTQAVKNFQSAKGLVADGIVGPLTWAALKGETPAPVPTPAPISTPTARLANVGIPTLWIALGLGLVGMVVLSGKR